MKSTANLLVALLLLCLSACGISHAQTVYGSIQGTITDTSGAAIPDALVTSREIATGIVQKVMTNQNGIYVLANLHPGTYEVVSHKSGFNDYQNSGVVVRVGDVIPLNMTLSVGGATSTVEVTSEEPLLRTDDTVVGSVIEESSIEQLPLVDRSPFDLALLTPGVQQAAVSNGTSGDSQPRLSGGRPRTNEFMLDGTSITDPRRGSSVVSPNLDAIQEFAVITNGIPAQYGRLAGGITIATLKSGTDQFHGNLFEFYRGEGLGTARNYFAATVPQLVYNQFGGIIGGPISRKRKLFFFSDYQGTRDRAQSIYNITLPTAMEEQGNFSDILGPTVGTDPLGRTVYKNEIFDPATTRTVNGQTVRDPFPGNIIPKSRWDAAGANIDGLYAQPTRPGTSQNFYSLQRGGFNHDQADGRVDAQLTPNDLAFVRLSYDRHYGIGTRPFPTAGGNLGEIDTFYDSSMAWTHTISSTIVNDVRLGFLRGELARLTPPTNVDALGIPNLVQEALPTIKPAGYNSIGDSARFDPTQAEYQVTDNVSMVEGRHIIRFGVDFRRFSINDLQLTPTSYNFNSLQTSNGTNSNTGNSFASLILGLSSEYVADTNTGRFYERSNYFATYLQDEFKMRRDFTANVGLRYDVEQNPNELDYNGSNFDLNTGQIITMRELGTNRVQYTQWHNFAPRIGFDWSPFGSRTVIRGSYGIFYMPLTGRATSAYDRFPKDQQYDLRSAGIASAVVISQTPQITPSVNGYGLYHYHDDPNAHVPYMQQISFDVERELPGQVLVQVGYTSSGARHLWENVQYNQIPIQEVQANGGGTQSMRPYPNFSNIGYFLEAQSTSYNALLIEAEKRYAHGLMLKASFTWSKFIDLQDDNFSGLFPQDIYNMKAERGISLANIPTRLVIAGIYDLPFGQGRTFLHNGLPSMLLGGWQMGGIFSVQSGQQVWIRSANNTSQTFDLLMRPNLVGNPTLSGGQRTLKHWFNTTAFQAPAPLNFGNAPRSSNIQGPPWYDVDLNLHRYIPIPLREGMRFELRGECFNCANHPNFLPPIGLQGSTTFGQITSAEAARTLQVAGKLWF